MIVFKSKDVDPMAAAHAFVNPMTALCLREKATRLAKAKGNPSMKVFLLGANSNLGTIFLNVCNDLKGEKKNFEVIPILRQEDKNIKSERFIKLSGSQ
jgi:NADPH:quinone reductase-like Zn-dependent oxidoreductase